MKNKKLSFFCLGILLLAILGSLVHKFVYSFPLIYLITFYILLIILILIGIIYARMYKHSITKPAIPKDTVEIRKKLNDFFQKKRKLGEELDKIQKSYISGQISEKEYSKELEKDRNGKTLGNWIEFYESEIRRYEKQLK